MIMFDIAFCSVPKELYISLLSG